MNNNNEVLPMGGAYGQSGSVFVLDGVATVNVEEETLDFGNSNNTANWNMIPKDVKMYMMNFMTVEDYARMRQVSKEWRRAGMKHHYAPIAKQREENFERQKRERLLLQREESARRRRAAARACCAPVRGIGKCVKGIGCGGWCIIFLITFYIAYSVMVGLFLFSPIFPEAPATIPNTEFRFPQANYIVASCTIRGFIANTALCYPYLTSTDVAYRPVFNVSVNGMFNRVAVASPGHPYYDCGYDSRLRSSSYPSQVSQQYVIGSSYTCFLDPLFVGSFSAITASNSITTKDFAILGMSVDTLNQWAASENYRVAGRILGYLWISITCMMIYPFIMLMVKVCCR